MELTNRALEERRAYNREYQKAWREKNKERVSNYFKEYRAEHKEAVREYNRRYWEKRAKQAE